MYPCHGRSLYIVPARRVNESVFYSWYLTLALYKYI